MPRYVALLRAINVGGHTVRMTELRTHFEEMGFDGVETFIASGNVVFTTRRSSAAKLESDIGGRLQAALGYEVTTFLRTMPELAAVSRFRAFPAAMLEVPGSSLYVVFLSRALGSAGRRRLLSLRTDVDDFAVRGREVYRYCRGKLLDSLVDGTALARAIGMPTTVRNITTVRKLVAKYRTGTGG